MGTANLLEALRVSSSAKVAVLITTDKVYRNVDSNSPYHEGDSLGGHDPYSASKAACEIVISCYRDAYLRDLGLAIASARAGNVIGGGDWSKDRLIPDAIKAWGQGESIKIRNPSAIRPWQHVLEPLSGYLILAQKLWQQPGLAGAYNFGPHATEVATVEAVINLAKASFGSGGVHIDVTDSNPHEASWLALDISKANDLLDFHPKWQLSETVLRTMAWYKNLQNGKSARYLCEAEIDDYEAFV